MSQAKLIDRGDMFQVTEDSGNYVGECTWSWQETNGQGSMRTYPITIYVKTICKVEQFSSFSISVNERLRIAQLAKQLFEANVVSCKVLVDESV